MGKSQAQANRKAAPKAAPKPAPKAGPGTVSALDRGLALLQCFGDGHPVLGPTDLARLTGIPRPSVTRLAATLVAHRWLRPEPGGERYMLGAGVVALAQVFLSGLDVRAAWAWDLPTAHAARLAGAAACAAAGRK